MEWQCSENIYECVQKIAMSRHASSIRAPKLKGFIVGADKSVIGILEHFIPHAGILGRMESIKAISSERRNIELSRLG
jgi:hypothetical protein